MLAALGAMLATMAETAAAAGTAVAEGAAAAGTAIAEGASAVGSGLAEAGTAIAEGASAAGETVAGAAGEATAGEAATAVASSAPTKGGVLSNLADNLVDKAKKSAGVSEGSGISRFFSGAGNSLAGKNPIVKLDNGDVDWYGTVGGFTGEVGKAVLNRQRNGRLLPIVASVAKGSMNQ